jgi:hypothetical protein
MGRAAASWTLGLSQLPGMLDVYDLQHVLEPALPDAIVASWNPGTERLCGLRSPEIIAWPSGCARPETDEADAWHVTSAR